MSYNNNLSNSKTMNSKVQYARYTLEQRIELINLVIENGISINQSAKEVGIKTSTAKLIVKKYKRDGSFTIRKSKPKAEERQQTPERAEVPKEESLQNEQQELIIPTPIVNYQAPDLTQNYLPEYIEPTYPFYFDQWFYFMPLM